MYGLLFVFDENLVNIIILILVLFTYMGFRPLLKTIFVIFNTGTMYQCSAYLTKYELTYAYTYK